MDCGNLPEKSSVVRRQIQSKGPDVGLFALRNFAVHNRNVFNFSGCGVELLFGHLLRSAGAKTKGKFFDFFFGIRFRFGYDTFPSAKDTEVKCPALRNDFHAILSASVRQIHNFESRRRCFAEKAAKVSIFGVLVLFDALRQIQDFV